MLFLRWREGSSMELKSGQLVVFVRNNGTVGALTFNGPFGGYEGKLKVPEDLRFTFEEVRTFIETEAAKYGLTAAEGSLFSPFVFDLICGDNQ